MHGRRLLVAVAGIAVCFSATPTLALLPTSPRVKALIEKGIDTLETTESKSGSDQMLGAQCLAGLAAYKGGRKKSPLVAAGVEACRQSLREASELDNYSHGLAIIFLSEVGPKEHEDLIRGYLSALKVKQKVHGGWGYEQRNTGDTSQSQYAALAMWQAHRGGVSIQSEMVTKLLDWLVKTQDPSGAWGYQGRVSDSELVAQTEITPTMVAAAGASLMIGSDLHGLLAASALDQYGGEGVGLPSGVRRVMEGQPQAAKALNAPAGFPWDRVNTALRDGEQWMDENDDMRPRHYACYYLYSLERYESFREVRAGEIDLEPDWYEAGVDYLEKIQKSPGVWNEACGVRSDTSFAVLFLMRSTQKSLAGGIGEGSLVSGIGLPKNFSGAKMRNGQVVVEMDAVGVADFLSLIEKGDADRLDTLAEDPSALVVGDLSESDATRLQQMLRSGEPDERLLAARALGRAGSLDNVPALLHGLTDPDAAVTLAARDALRFIARRPKGFGMPDDFTDDQRYQTLEEWKNWYLALRPEASGALGR